MQKNSTRVALEALPCLEVPRHKGDSMSAGHEKPWLVPLCLGISKHGRTLRATLLLCRNTNLFL
jgi:hypothetical protein